MRKKIIAASLLTIGLAAGVGTQIHAQDTTYICGGNHSHMHNAVEGCMRTLKEQQAVGDAVARRQAEAAQKQAQAAQKQNAEKTPAISASNTTVQTAITTETAENTSYTNSAQQPDSIQTVSTQSSANTAASPCPYHENCDGNHQHNENCDGIHQHNENCNNGMQGNHHKGGSGQGMHHSTGNGHHRR